MDTQKIALQVTQAVRELIAVSGIQAGQILVVGCSTSEVIGQKIGTMGSSEAAASIFKSLQAVATEKGIYLAVQCCEHLNRALVTTRAVAEKYNLVEVTVRPMPHAGGAMATIAYESLVEPIIVETITAHAGIDIGQTLIGMHLKRVAVPVCLQEKKIGEAVLTAARTRPPLIGGERAQYPK